MSVLDQVRALEQEVLQRLRELRPLVAEYRDLEKVAERLGIKRDRDDAIETAPPPGKPAAKRRAKRAARARASKRAAATKPKPKAVAKARAKAGAKPRAKSAAKPRPKAAATAKSAAASTPARGSRGRPKPSARKRSAAAPGERERDVVRLVGERPGVTVAELAAELGVDATGLYGVVRRLQGKGQIIKDRTQLRLSDAAVPAGDNAPDVASESPAGSLDTGAAAAEDSAPAAGASTPADESS